MAILITNDGDKTVANIGARDAITRKFDGMNVTVLDAIADTSVGGGGVAGYQWSSTLSRWMLMFKENKDNLTFLRENLVITDGAVTSQYVPTSGLVWDCVIIDSNGLIVADVVPTITGTTISVDSSAYNGLYLNFTYAYGIAEAAAGIITKSSIGLGNVDNTSDLAKPISTATQTALNLKADVATTYTKTETIAAISLYAPAPASYTSLAEYGITDAYTINESNALLDLKENVASKGVANGYVPLNASTKIATTYLPDSIVGALIFQGTWNASTNSPAIPTAATSNKGFYYVTSVAGSTSVSGVAEWKVGDWLVSNGTSWDKVDNTDAVSSVNGRLGAITLTSTDVGLGNVDNTSDLNKPVSTATTAAIAAKVTPYDIAGGISGKPVASDPVIMFVSPRAFTIPANLVGSYAKLGTAPTSAAVFNINKNGSLVATASFAISATTGTFSTQAAITGAAGDIFTVTAPASVDATMSDVYITLLAAL